MQWRASRRQRAREAEVLILRSFESPDFTRAMHRILALPNGLSKKEVDAQMDRDLLWYWFGAMESVGLLVHHRAIDLGLVDEAFGGPIILSWSKLGPYARESRKAVKRESMHEWFQWLAERLAELERPGRIAAQIRERDWKP
jgi:hypothetical protein